MRRARPGHPAPRPPGRGGAGGEFAGVFSQETIERYIAESLDLLGDARINVFVPVLAHRFARERLKALGQAEGTIVKEHARGAVRLRPQRGAQPDGGGARQAPRRGQRPRPLRRQRPRRGDQPGRRRGDGRARRRSRRGVPEAAHRRGRPRRRRRDHDGLRRRLPDLPGQALRGLGARRPGRPGRRDRSRASATRSTRACRRCSPSSLPTESDAARPPRSLAEAIGTFALVFAGCGAIMVDAKTRRARPASGSRSPSGS